MFQTNEITRKQQWKGYDWSSHFENCFVDKGKRTANREWSMTQVFLPATAVCRSQEQHLGGGSYLIHRRQVLHQTTVWVPCTHIPCVGICVVFRPTRGYRCGSLISIKVDSTKINSEDWPWVGTKPNPPLPNTLFCKKKKKIGLAAENGAASMYPLVIVAIMTGPHPFPKIHWSMDGRAARTLTSALVSEQSLKVPEFLWGRGASGTLYVSVTPPLGKFVQLRFDGGKTKCDIRNVPDSRPCQSGTN